MATTLMTPEEAAQALRIGRSRVYDFIRTGELTSTKIGNSRRITEAALEAFVDSLSEAN